MLGVSRARPGLRGQGLTGASITDPSFSPLLADIDRLDVETVVFGDLAVYMHMDLDR